MEQMAASASEAARLDFALGTIDLLRQKTEAAIQNEFTGQEQGLLHGLLANLEHQPASESKAKLRELVDLQCEDAVRAIEFHPHTTDLLCALDNWFDFQMTREPDFIARIANNMVDSIDYSILEAVGGYDIGDYSIENILGAPAMVAELRRQQRILTAREPPEETEFDDKEKV